MAQKPETHISMLVETKEKLQAIAKRESRTMRAVLVRLIDKEFEKEVK